MLTRMTEADWSVVLEVFDAAQSRSGEPGHNDRKFLEALRYFTVHSITWRALPAEFGNWNSIWKRFWRLSRSGVFEAFLQLLAETSKTAHVVQFFDSTVVRALAKDQYTMFMALRKFKHQRKSLTTRLSLKARLNINGLTLHPAQ